MPTAAFASAVLRVFINNSNSPQYNNLEINAAVWRNAGKRSAKGCTLPSDLALQAEDRWITIAMDIIMKDAATWMTSTQRTMSGSGD